MLPSKQQVILVKEGCVKICNDSTKAIILPALSSCTGVIVYGEQDETMICGHIVAKPTDKQMSGDRIVAAINDYIAKDKINKSYRVITYGSCSENMLSAKGAYDLISDSIKKNSKTLKEYPLSGFYIYDDTIYIDARKAIEVAASEQLEQAYDIGHNELLKGVETFYTSCNSQDEYEFCIMSQAESNDIAAKIKALTVVRGQLQGDDGITALETANKSLSVTKASAPVPVGINAAHGGSSGVCYVPTSVLGTLNAIADGITNQVKRIQQQINGPQIVDKDDMGLSKLFNEDAAVADKLGETITTSVQAKVNSK